MDNTLIKTAAVLIIAGTLLLLFYGFMVLTGDAGGPMWAQVGGAAALIIGIVFLLMGKKQT